MSIWVDVGLTPREGKIEQAEAQNHRRFFKTHLPLDGIPYQEATKYVVVFRDGRDISMSQFNHLVNYNNMMLERLKARSPEFGPAYPGIPNNLNAYWRDWRTKGWFEWEQDGWPMWSDLHVMQSWWEYRHQPNIRLFHYANMLADTPGAIRDLADYLSIPISEERVMEIAGVVSFDNMKANSDQFVPAGGRMWKGGGDTFFNKGTNGRWRDEITPENLALYDQAADRALSPECRQWIENAGPMANDGA
jgi:aryl sulfotransferase